ncbi:MAG: hypothetical protein ACJ749_02245, partial [Flavisolibacter sp.]
MHRLILFLSFCIVLQVHGQGGVDELKSKMSYRLSDNRLNGADSIDVSVSVKNTSEFLKLKKLYHLLNQVATDAVVVRVKKDDLEKILRSTEVIFVNEQH